MRKIILAGLATLAFSTIVSAAQRGAAMPAMPAAPAPAMHAMPAPAAGMHAPVTGAHAPMAGAPHAPVAGNHLVSPRGSGPAHPGASRSGVTPARPGNHLSNISSKPNALPRKPGTANNFPVNPIAPPPFGQKPFIPGFLPPDAFTGNSCFFGNCYPVPGFGFDYEHFFAVHPNWGKFQPQFTGVVIPGWGGGFYYPVPYYTEGEQQQEQDQNASAPAEQQESSVRASAPAPAQEEPVPTMGRSYNYTPAQPVEEYVFVKRDGTRIFAVAYSLTKDKLSYVTKDGLRRTVSLDALDYDATMKSNEERGNSITLPGIPPAAMAMLK